ncbi:MAG: tetratricopeptide repeat protein [bacterium]
MKRSAKQMATQAVKKTVIGFTAIVFFLLACAGGKSHAVQQDSDGQVPVSDQTSVSDHAPGSDQAPESGPAPANDRVTVKERDAFARGYRLFEKKEYQKAAPYLYRFLNKNSPDADDYEWAEFFFGICLNKCGLSHGAVDTLTHLVTRKPNPRIISYCLELFEEITRTIPFDRDLLINTVICDQEYGLLEKDMADFINYYQGVFDWEQGFFQWGNDHFQKISPKSYYFSKYLFQKALLRVYQDRIDEAVAISRDILESPGSGRPDAGRAEADELSGLKDEVAVTLARLLYEKGRFEEAEGMYQKIRKPLLEQAQNLFERAWTNYRMGNLEKAMGLLYAFEAPSFQDYFTPEYYILKSLIYKDVCHYQRALAVVNEFKTRYGCSLQLIYGRGTASDDTGLLLLLLNKKKINESWEFLKLLDREKEKSRGFLDKPLKEYLERVYTLEIEKITGVFRKQIEDEYEKMANELLKFEEQVNLMEYEIGLDMYQRVYQYHYRKESQLAQKPAQGVAVYPFQGEFWNDELDDYTVTLPDKCNCIEEWDIFFK